MHHGALCGWKFRQGFGQLVAKGGFVRITGGREDFLRLRAQFPVIFFAGAAPAHQVNRRVVRETDEKLAFAARRPQKFRLPRQLRENFLEHIPSVRLVPGEMQEEREQRPGVFVVEPLQFRLGGHQLLR